MNEVDANNLFPIGGALTRRFLVFRVDCPCGDEDVRTFFNMEEFSTTKKRELVSKIVSEEVKPTTVTEVSTVENVIPTTSSF
jgi:hypothetical protein